METENAIIIALIVIILLVLSVFVFISSNNLTLNHNSDVDPVTNSSLQVNNTIVRNTSDSTAHTGITAPASDSGSEQNEINTDSNTETSDANSAASQTVEQQTTDSESASQQTPQAGQSEGTYDPSDFD